ncbi:hypothetical protein BBJ28_00001442 [Nothophytophthora sp. Chile5]|nr:hypothetical protein BBJ28_00001442 [Nothophytophthora sp. Chile5]
MFLARQPKRAAESSSGVRDIKPQSARKQPAALSLFELDTYLAKRDFAGALTLLRVLRRHHEQQAQKEAPEGNQLSSWCLNTWWEAYCHFQLADFGQALANFEQLIDASAGGDATATDLKSWRLSQACCLYYLGSLEDAEHAALGSSRSALCNRLLFLLAHRRQHAEQALLDRYQQLSRDFAEDQLALAATSFSQHNYQEAVEIYKQLLAKSNKGRHEGGSALHVYLALCYYKLDYYDVAMELLAVYLADHPDSFFAMNLKACCNYRLYSVHEAKSVVDDFVKRFPGHPCAQYVNDAPAGTAASSTSSRSAIVDVMQHNLAIFRVSDGDSSRIEMVGAATERVLGPLVGQIEEAQTNLVLVHLKRREYHKAFALVEELEPRTATELAVKAVLHGVIGEQTHSKEHVFLAEKYFHAAGSTSENADTIPGRQCMASYFLLRREFNDANVYLKSIATYLSADDAFNWNYGVSLAATGAYREAEELLLRVQSPELRGQLVFCGWLARCYILGDGRTASRAALAWELYLKIEDSQVAFALLKQIANDCYKVHEFFYAAKAFDVLERLDPDPEYWEAKRGACLGFFRQVAAGHESESGAALNYRCEEVLKLLGNSKNVLEGSKLAEILRKWTRSFLPSL